MVSYKGLNTTIKTIKILIYSYAEIALINKRNGRMHRGDIEKGIIYSKYKEWT